MNLDKLKSLHFRLNEGLALCSDPAINYDAGKLKTNSEDQTSTSSTANRANEGLRNSPSLDLVKEASRFCKNSRQQNSRCKVFVGNVSYKVKPNELKSFFEYFGKVISAQVIRDRIKKRSRG